MARKGRKAQATASRFPTGLVAGIAIAAVVIGAIAFVAMRADDIRGCTPTGQHEHTGFAVFANNRPVSYADAAFDFPRSGRLAGHIHQPNHNTIHLEGDCTTLDSFFEGALHGRLSADELRLDDIVHDGSTYRDGADGQLRFFLGAPPADWKGPGVDGYLEASQVEWREVDDLSGHQPRDGEYVLVTFGNDSDETIRAQQLSIPKQNAAE